MTLDLAPTRVAAVNARLLTDDIAFSHETGGLSFRELDEHAAGLATVLGDRAGGEGDQFAYVGANSASLPCEVRVVAALPRNASGKLDKKALHTLVAETS